MDIIDILNLGFLNYNFYVFFNDSVFRKLQKKNPKFYKQNDDILGCPHFREPRLLFQLKNENIDETINEHLSYCSTCKKPARAICGKEGHKKTQNHYIKLENLEQSSISTLFSQISQNEKDKQKFIEKLIIDIYNLTCGYLGVGCIYVEVDLEVIENFNFFKNARPHFIFDVGDNHLRHIYEFYLVVSRKNQKQCKLRSSCNSYTNTSLNSILIPVPSVYYKSKKAKSRSKNVKKSKSKLKSKLKSKKVGLRNLKNM